MRSNLHLRTASRVTVRLGEFFAATFSELRSKAAHLDWEKYLYPSEKLNIRAVCHKSKLYHSDGVAERILGAINDHFSSIPGSNKPVVQDPSGQIVLVRLVNDMCTISIDSSGELLHKRGYRQAVAKAPLRETLAAAMILASGWDKGSPLIDPFCGSGTIPIEAALLAANVPPGLARDFAFIKWPTFVKKDWEEILEVARKGITQTDVNISGFDRDTGAVDMALANAARAGQKDRVDFKPQAISFLEPTGTPGWIVTNPPYGVRISDNNDLRDLYSRFGEILKTKFKGWNIGILCNDRRLMGNLNLGKAGTLLRFSNGGIPVQYEVFRQYSENIGQQSE